MRGREPATPRRVTDKLEKRCDQDEPFARTRAMAHGTMAAPFRLSALAIRSGSVWRTVDDGLLVKARRVLWLRGGTLRADDEGTTDFGLALSIVRDLLANDS
jgi:hypothetical protein